MAPTTTARPRADGATPKGPGGSRWTYLGAAVLIGVALMWIWIFSGAPKKVNPDRLADREWVERAEDTCRATMDRVDERSEPGDTQEPAARADAIDASSDDLEEMVDDLADPPPSEESDREVVQRWLDDWDVLIEDRRTYAETVREDPDARFLITEKFNDGIDDVIGTFAEVNEMPSCGPAGDVG